LSYRGKISLVKQSHREKEFWQTQISEARFFSSAIGLVNFFNDSSAFVRENSLVVFT